MTDHLDTDAELTEQLKRVRSDLAERRRTRRRIVALAAAVLVALVASGLAVVAIVSTRSQADQRDADRVERAVAACQQDNDAIRRINAGNDAAAATRNAVATVQQELDSLLAPLVLTPPPADPAAAARQRQFVDTYQAGRQAVDDALVNAAGLLAAARVPERDCSPAGLEVYLSTTTTTSPP